MVLIGASIIKYNVFFMFAKILLFFPFVNKEMRLAAYNSLKK